LFPLTRKKVPVATPSSPRVRPTPQNTAGPTPGRATSTSRKCRIFEDASI